MKRFLTILIAVLCACPAPVMAAATQVDSLIGKLVDKGILTKNEARELKMEIAEDAKAIQEDGIKSSLPDWVKNTKLKGDLRLRYQHESRENTRARDRARLRYRLGLITNINKQVELGAGLASGSDDPRSTNQTFENSFQTPDIRLDYAYAKFTPNEQLSLTGGKFAKPFWNAKDLIFDSDLMFEGGALNLTHKLHDTVSLFGAGGYFLLDENQVSGSTTVENDDAQMYVFQAGVDLKPVKDVKLKLVGTYYGYGNIRDKFLLSHRTASNTTRTLNGNSVYKYDYDAYSMGAELDFDNPFKMEAVPGLGFFGEMITNSDADEHDEGYIVGAWIGDKKISGPKQWQLGYNFRRLERNAVLDNFPDSDFYGGATHVQGHEATFSLGLSKNISLDLDYYRSAPIGASATAAKKEAIEHLWQTDLNFKF